MREKFLFATWKNRVGYAQSASLAREIAKKMGHGSLSFQLVLCPASVALAAIRDTIQGTNIQIAGQNIIWDQSAACTGEITAQMLLEIGCKYVIIGHSERRIYLGETDDMIRRKVATSLKHGLVPIICVGETYEQRAEGIREKVVKSQLLSAIDGLKLEGYDQGRVVLAYEPAWSISTSEVAIPLSASEANRMHRWIRDIHSEMFSPEFAENTTIVYGGSVDTANAASYFQQPEIDGGLVGSATQSLESLNKLIDIAHQVWVSRHK